MGCTHGVYGIAISCSALMPGKLSIIAPDGGCACVDRSSADATEIVVAATNTAKIIERMAFSPLDAALQIERNATEDQRSSFGAARIS